ncbi:Mu transposase C-terminal domain-containing protein [Sphingobium sp. RSMS]|uniref:Mu transposase C-terminal domain-containing protein n=1 Tax=Sphingobium sp. RSMS TaxID=520734 RepID=UPI0010F46E08|nr:Mu transposase C-terminal domain-containing protein [Sphingobium sp. RSMS]UXC90283.1 Mu transposase C-terminal domain-containing protein [Sphingobium sp. RSMS]
MPVKIFRLQRGDSIALKNGDGSSSLWRVLRRVRDGYWLASQRGDPDRLWKHEEIYALYVAGETEIWPCNLAALDPGLAEMLQSDLESWPPRKIFEAKCREEYVRRADVLRARGVSAKIAYRRAAKTVLRAHGTEWARQAERIDAAEKALASRKRRKAISTALASVPAIAPYKLSEYSVRNWFIQWEKGGRDLRALIAQDHRRGDHRRRKICKLDEQTDDNMPLCVYGAMAWVGRSVWMQIPRVPKSYAYKRLSELCSEKGFETVSNTTFYSFLNSHFSEFEEYRARYGPRKAYLKYHIFERRSLPDRALEEVEVDHCLLDVFVTDEQGRKARPWLTVLICRATKMILGIHLSFEVPSYATLSRAIIHAMAPKDLSGMPDIKNDWPCHGVFDMLITDRGLEFLSESFQRAGRDLKFAIVNLPGRMPHLKATVERFFGGLGVRVLTHMEGTTLSRTDQYYDPQARAKFSLAELTAKIVKWIVDDYHYAEHGTLGMAPVNRWKQLVEDDEINGGIRPVGSFSRLVMLMGERVRRKISNVGIHFENNIYASVELEALRKRRNGLEKEVEILADPTDRGHLWVLDTVEKRWIVVPAVNRRISKGLNKFASRIVMRMARKIAGRGQEITDNIMLDARERCETEALTAHNRSALRFCSDGAMATNLIGNNGILAVLAGPMDAAHREDNDQGVLFPDLVELPPRDAHPTEATCEPVGPARDTSASARPAEQPVPTTQNHKMAADDLGVTTEGGEAQEQRAESKGMGALRLLIGRRSEGMSTIR